MGNELFWMEIFMPNCFRVFLSLACLLFGGGLIYRCDNVFDGNWSVKGLSVGFIGASFLWIGLLIGLLPVGWR